jgi:hypothetical protein
LLQRTIERSPHRRKVPKSNKMKHLPLGVRRSARTRKTPD